MGIVRGSEGRRNGETQVKDNLSVIRGSGVHQGDIVHNTILSI